MIPHEKELVERMQDEPFALIGVNSDGDRDVLAPKLEENGITWRQAVDLSTDGVLASRWNVHAWPTIYVLDAEGKIRFRNVRNEALEEAVKTLLAELKGEEGKGEEGMEEPGDSDEEGGGSDEGEAPDNDPEDE